MTAQAWVLLGEDVVLCVATVLLFRSGHSTAGAWALTGLLANTCLTSWTPPAASRSDVPPATQEQK